MDKQPSDRYEDTGKIELEKLLSFLNENNYKYKDVRKTIHYGYSIAVFKKDISYSEKSGNWINDRHIKIYVEYDDDFDYKNIHVKDKNEDSQFNHKKSQKFIKNILNKEYDNEDTK